MGRKTNKVAQAVALALPFLGLDGLINEDVTVAAGRIRLRDDATHGREVVGHLGGG